MSQSCGLGHHRSFHSLDESQCNGTFRHTRRMLNSRYLLIRNRLSIVSPNKDILSPYCLWLTYSKVRSWLKFHNTLSDIGGYNSRRRFDTVNVNYVVNAMYCCQGALPRTNHCSGMKITRAMTTIRIWTGCRRSRLARYPATRANYVEQTPSVYASTPLPTTRRQLWQR